MEDRKWLQVFCLWIAALTVASAQDVEAATVKPDLLETEVLGLRVWMIIGIVGVGLTVVVVALCCFFDCRIPRTKAEIEADHENAKLIQQYRDTIERAPKGKKVKVIKAIPSSALGLDAGAGPSSPPILMDESAAGHGAPAAGAGGEVPLAQHPSTLLTGGNEPHLSKPLATTRMRPGLLATIRTLASLGRLHKQRPQPDAATETEVASDAGAHAQDSDLAA